MTIFTAIGESASRRDEFEKSEITIFELEGAAARSPLYRLSRILRFSRTQ